ncbi:biotin synthase BioB [Lachnospiraceae bacterium NSJ-143]|nr:biotin synthase BioB [Lachnospiraceae bacterium NSJ-143]
MSGEDLDMEQAFALYFENSDELSDAANKIRMSFCGSKFDFCTIVNAKSGACSEDCKFCAQSSFYDVKEPESYGLNEALIIKNIDECSKSVIKRLSIVTSGRSLNDGEIKVICDLLDKKNTGINICVSGGLMSFEQFIKLKKSGVTRIHCNIETSRDNFKNICSTHTFEDKINTIKYAQMAGLEVCSGGIIGLGESYKDRISMAYELKKLNIKSIPVNILNPIKGTPFENKNRLLYDDIIRTLAVFRFILPDSFIRLAGGRRLLNDNGRRCLLSGANAAITGDMLTTKGIAFTNDKNMIEKLGFID